MLYNYLITAVHPLYHLNNDQPSVFVVVAQSERNALALVDHEIGTTPDLKVQYLGIADKAIEPTILHTAYRIEEMDEENA